jgi:hypothetical protein
MATPISPSILLSSCCDLTMWNGVVGTFLHNSLMTQNLLLPPTLCTL